jgi:RNA polymerase sigma-70 factor (ECF subfamily)
MTQEELLVVYKKDERAFTHSYDMYSKSLFSVINVLVSNREEAEDVLQRSLLRFGKTLILIMKVKDALYLDT